MFKFADMDIGKEIEKLGRTIMSGKAENNTGVSDHLEFVRPVSRDDASSHEKNELRPDRDGKDHYQPNKVGFKFVMTVIGCIMAFIGSQLLPLVFLTLNTYIARQLNDSANYIWFYTAPIVGSVAAAIFVGPFSDLFGRKSFFLTGVGLVVLGMIVCASTPTGTGYIAGQTLAGFGVVVEELLALAVIAEIVPTKQRPIYGVVLVSGFVPWVPGTLYAQLISKHNWRYVPCLLAVWHALTIVIIGAFYRPPPQGSARGKPKMEVFRQIDWLGGILSIAGLVFFLVGLNWGGKIYPWDSARVVSFLCVGIVLCLAFAGWERYEARHPIFPRRLIYAPRPFWCIMLVIFAAGVNFISLVVFWPIQSISVYNSDQIRTGINTIPIGCCILGGAIMSGILIQLFKKHVNWIMTFFCIVQTAGIGGMCAVDPHNINTAWAPVIFGLIGIGGVLFPNQLVATIITPDDLLATITALTFALRAASQVIGLSVFYSELVRSVTANTYTDVVPAVVKAGIYNVTQIEDLMNGLTAIPFRQYAPLLPELDTPQKYEMVRQATVACFGKSFQIVYFVALAFGGLACIASVFMGDVSRYMDEHVAVLL